MINLKNLTHFVSIMPTDQEAQLFRQRLVQFNLQTLQELHSIPICMSHIGRSEKLMIKLLSYEGLIERAKLVHQLMQTLDQLNKTTAFSK